MTDELRSRHIGALSATFADGALGWEYPGDEVLVRWVDGHALSREQGQSRPASAITGWVHWCQCGWWSRPWTRALNAADEDLTARRAYSPHSSPPPSIEETSNLEWANHIQN